MKREEACISRVDCLFVAKRIKRSKFNKLIGFHLSTNYLLDASVSEKEKCVKLTFFNSSKNEYAETVDYDYHPYLFIRHPVPEPDLQFIKESNVKTKLEHKIDFFTGKKIEVTKVTLKDYSDPQKFSRNFTESWENDVPVISSYMYDHGLVFGVPYKIEGKELTPIHDIAKKDLDAFRKAFLETKRSDPKKYELSENLFLNCSQPVPEISLQQFGIKNKVDPNQLYLMFTLARLTNLPVPQAYSNRGVSTWIKSLMHNYLRKQNILIPTSTELRRGETAHSVKGALTLTPKPGAHFNTVVVDFDSMYPSLIDSYNLSHETIDCPHKECQSNKVPQLPHHVCTKRRGVYSLLIGSLKDLRIHWFKPRSKNKKLSQEECAIAEATSKMLKLILVSSYGVVVRIHGLSRPSLGESITAYGRHSLKTAQKIAKQKGLNPIYGDTDSLFLENPTEKDLQWLIETVKTQLKLHLSIEQRYTLCVLPEAAKAYFGIKKDGTVDIKGLTAIKSNSPNFFQSTFNKSIKELTTVQNQSQLEGAKKRIKQIVEKAIKDLKSGKIAVQDLEYQVEIHERPEEKLKAKALHQPYQSALQLRDSGKTVKTGDTMHFVKVNPFSYKGRKFTVKPTEHVNNLREINIDDYTRNLKAALNQVFKPMKIDFSDQERAKTLSDFN